MERDLKITKYFKKKLTPQICFNFCTKKRYKFAGLQNRYQCFCGNSFGKYGKLESKKCSCKCDGDKRKNCGCALTNMIYQLPKYKPVYDKNAKLGKNFY